MSFKTTSFPYFQISFNNNKDVIVELEAHIFTSVNADFDHFATTNDIGPGSRDGNVFGVLEENGN